MSRLDLTAAKKLTQDELATVSPHLARIAERGLIDAYTGPGGTFIVYGSGTQIYVCTMRDTPMMVEVCDLHGWSGIDFAVPSARALAAGAIACVDANNGALEISEGDCDRAWESYRAPPPTGLLQRRLTNLPWGVAPDDLDIALRISGYWNEDKTSLLLLLKDDLAPFKKLEYRFTDGRLTAVNARSWLDGDWKAMESLEAGLRRHLPDAVPYEMDTDVPWSAAGSRARLEGQDRVTVRIQFAIEGMRMLGAATALRGDGRPQTYALAVVALPP